MANYQTLARINYSLYENISEKEAEQIRGGQDQTTSPTNTSVPPTPPPPLLFVSPGKDPVIVQPTYPGEKFTCTYNPKNGQATCSE